MAPQLLGVSTVELTSRPMPGRGRSPARALPRAAATPTAGAVRGLLAGCTCLLAASLTLDAILGGYDPTTRTGFRSPSWYIGLVTLAVAIPSIPALARVATSCRPLLFMFAAFTVGLVVLVVQSAGGPGALQTEGNLDRPYKSMLMAVIFIAVASERSWRRRLLHSFVAGWAAYISLALFLEAAGQTELLQHIGGVTRRTVLAMNANDVSCLAAAGVLLVLHWAVTARSPAGVVAAMLCVLAGLGVFLFGNSRTALLGLVAGLATLGWLTLRPGGGGWGSRAARIGVVSALSLAVTLWLLISSPLVSEMWDAIGIRVAAATSGEDRGQRDNLALATLDLAFENPFGVGMGRTIDLLQSDPHNSYLKIAAEGGVVATMFLVAAGWSMLPYFRRAAAATEDHGVLAAFAMLAVSAVFGQALVQSPIWLFFALVVTAPEIRSRGSRPAEFWASRAVFRSRPLA